MIGVLALQGNYHMHCKMLSELNVKNILIRNKDDLKQCDGLIIPGGESTVISKMMDRYNLLNPIKRFSENNSIFGTCAGLILMTNYNFDNIQGLDILNIDVLRNGWGRQINSFTDNIDINIDRRIEKFKATFIRAPKIKKVTKSVKILSSINKEPVMVRQGKHIGTTFHPEMHNNPLIHKYFINIINE